LFTDPSGLWTRQIGLSVSFTAFGISGTAFAGVAYDSDGNVGSYCGWGGGSGIGGSWGDSDHGVVVGGSATFGPGLGVTSFNGITNTYVQPLR
jgi:hypothetical protein